MGKPVESAEGRVGGVVRRVGGAFYCPLDGDHTVWWFTEKPPWEYDQVMTVCKAFRTPLRANGCHEALAALCVGYFDDPDHDYLNMHPSWQPSFERARAYIEECRCEQAVPRDTFDYLFTCSF
jgi:hypothetical protein